jgi:hypothetical protein
LFWFLLLCFASHFCISFFASIFHFSLMSLTCIFCFLKCQLESLGLPLRWLTTKNKTHVTCVSHFLLFFSCLSFLSLTCFYFSLFTYVSHFSFFVCHFYFLLLSLSLEVNLLLVLLSLDIDQLLFLLSFKLEFLLPLLLNFKPELLFLLSFSTWSTIALLKL